MYPWEKYLVLPNIWLSLKKIRLLYSQQNVLWSQTYFLLHFLIGKTKEFCYCQQIFWWDNQILCKLNPIIWYKVQNLGKGNKIRFVGRTKLFRYRKEIILLNQQYLLSKTITYNLHPTIFFVKTIEFW